MTATEAMFWIALLVISYTYIGYPAVLWLISRMVATAEQNHAGNDGELPSVSLIISAYNEEKVIGTKIENARSLDYPRKQLEIIVVSDGSSDRTCAIAQSFADKGVLLRHYEGRIGKTACLNRALPLATGRIIVFSDANSAYEKGALKALLRPFQDSTVGFVTGWTRYGSVDEMSAMGSIGFYSKLELITKELESRLGSCIGADGAIFAIRKELYLPLKDYDINDFVIPLSIIERGYRGVLQREAICYERDAGSTKGEFKRQVRITSRTIRATVNHRQLLNPFRFGLFSFELFSHKVCKFLVPLFMIALFISNLLLTERESFYTMALAAQGIFYSLAGLAVFLPTGTILGRMAEAAKTFVVVNAAMAFAWISYFQGRTYTTWSPTKR